MNALRAALVLTLLCAGSVQAQTDAAAAAALEGAWVRVNAISPTGEHTPSLPGVRTFVNGWYSWMQAPADRASVDSTATAAQLRTAWGSVTATTGRYEVVGQTLTQHPMVDRVPANMVPDAYMTFAYRVVADTMWITQIANSTTTGPLTNQASGKYVRVR